MSIVPLQVDVANDGENELTHVSSSRLSRVKRRIDEKYSRVPLLKKLPPRAVAIIIFLIFVNLCVWVAVGIVLNYHSALSGTAILAYTFGLRHALDADHISAIDLMTRRLVATGQRPVTVGTWFSLGHSTIVIVTSIVVAATASAISERFNSFSKVGGIIGSSVSAAFLLILGAANAYILYILVRQMKRILRRRVTDEQEEENTGGGSQEEKQFDWKIEGAGVLFRVFRKLFRLIDRPWKMYPVGIVFGLGFDTSSEVALLGISSIQAAHGTSLWLILIFPILFTAGMCLIDTIDGALMLALYSSANLARDILAVLYYNIALTCLTVVVAVVIGVLQVLGLVIAVVGDKKLTQSGGGASRNFWKGAQEVGDSYDIVGACICGLFIVVGIGTVLLYRPWRRWVDRRYPLSSTSMNATLDGAGDTVHVVQDSTQLGTSGTEKSEAFKQREIREETEGMIKTKHSEDGIAVLREENESAAISYALLSNR